MIPYDSCPLSHAIWFAKFCKFQELANGCLGVLDITAPILHHLKFDLLMEEILHQLIGSLAYYLQVFNIPGGAGFLPLAVVLNFKPYKKKTQP